MKVNEETTVSEEQVLFNKLSYEEQQFILKQMRLLQPCELSCEIEEKKITPNDFENLGYALGSIKKYINKGYDKAIEEKKIPEKLTIYDCIDAYSKFDINDNRKAINEILDYLKSKGE